MINYYVENRMTDTFAGLIAISGCSKIHLNVITEIIWNSKIVKELDAGKHKELINKTPLQLFEELFSVDISCSFFKASNVQKIQNSEQYSKFYWCGWALIQLYLEFNKPLSYLMLIIPLVKLINIYPVYHEMDLSQLFIYYEEIRNSSTIMKRLTSYRKISSTKLSNISGISVNTINYYKKADVNVYKATFQNIYALSLSLHVPPGMFLDKTIQHNR